MPRYCKNPTCGKHLPSGGATVIEAHRYGYCSWNCLKQDDPELARQLEEKSEASQKAAIAILILICTVVFAGIRWFLRQRTDNPTRFEKIAAYGGIALAVCVVMGSQEGISSAIKRCDVARADVCWSIRGMYHTRFDSILKDEEMTKKLTDPKSLAKAGIRCPDGGEYKVRLEKKMYGDEKEYRLYCPKHSPIR